MSDILLILRHMKIRLYIVNVLSTSPTVKPTQSQIAIGVKVTHQPTIQPSSLLDIRTSTASSEINRGSNRSLNAASLLWIVLLITIILLVICCCLYISVHLRKPNKENNKQASVVSRAPERSRIGMYAEYLFYGGLHVKFPKISIYGHTI